MMNNNSNNGGNFIMANNTINSLQVFAGIIKEAFTSVYPDNKVFVREVRRTMVWFLQVLLSVSMILILHQLSTLMHILLSIRTEEP